MASAELEHPTAGGPWLLVASAINAALIDGRAAPADVASAISKVLLASGR